MIKSVLYLCPNSDIWSAENLPFTLGTCNGQYFLWVWQYNIVLVLPKSMISPKTHVPYVEERIFWQLGSRSTAHLISTRWTPRLCLGKMLVKAASRLRSAYQDGPTHVRELQLSDFEYYLSIMTMCFSKIMGDIWTWQFCSQTFFHPSPFQHIQHHWSMWS